MTSRESERGTRVASPDAERAVRQLLSDITLNDDCLRCPPDTALETVGIDSVGMIELVYGLEDRLAIRITDEEVAPEHFTSVGSLTALVIRKCRS